MKSQSRRKPRHTRKIYIPRLVEATGMETRRGKQRRLELSGSASPTVASTIILIYAHADNNTYAYSVFSLKVAAPENGNTDTVPPIPEPIFRFPRKNFPEKMGFATLGSKIYIIGGRQETHSPSSWRTDFPSSWKTDSPSLSETDSPAYPYPFSFSLNTYVLDTAKPQDFPLS